MKVENTCSIVTGGSKGIGKAIVDLLISRGGNVVIGDILDQDGQKLADELNKSGKKRAVYAHCDVTDTNQLENLFKVATEEFGGAQILFNNAGINEKSDAYDDIVRATKIYQTNLTSVFQGTILAKKHFDEQSEKTPTKSFCIMNTCSLSALEPFVDFPIYSFTKNAVWNFTSIFSQLNWKNIRINSIAPGFTRTDILKDEEEQSDDTQILDQAFGLMEPEFIADKMLELIEDDEANGVVRFVEANRISDGTKITVNSLNQEVEKFLVNGTLLSSKGLN